MSEVSFCPNTLQWLHGFYSVKDGTPGGSLSGRDASMRTDNKAEFSRGMRHGWPIGVGYFAVSFALGIAAKNAGFSALQAAAMSAACTASAGEFAGITVAAAGGSLPELALMELIVNARYMLMSCALTQKLRPELPFRHRLLLAPFITDEIFGLSLCSPEELNPFYTYGIAAVSWPGWILGTFLGVVVGNILPANLVSALSVGLYGMFLAIIIPPTRKDPVLAGLIPLSMGLSLLLSRLSEAGRLPLSGGSRIILLTVLISFSAALLFPHRDDEQKGLSS